MRGRSLRWELALCSALVSGLVVVGFGVAAWIWLRNERVATLDREIRALAYRHPGWASGRANPERVGRAIEFVFGEERREELVLRLTDATGARLFQSPHWPAALDTALAAAGVPEAAEGPTGADGESRAGLSGSGRGAGLRAGPGWGRMGAGPPDSGMFTRAPRFQTVVAAPGTWRIGLLGSDEHLLLVGLDFGTVERELNRFRDRFVLTLVPALLLVGGGGWWLGGRALRPLRTITATAEQVTARGLDQRIPEVGSDPEVARLVKVFNGMLDRLEASFRQATRFSADASHELKTPLAIMQGEIEQALAAAEPGSREQQTLAGLMESTDRLKSITRSLLLLARADAGQLPLAREPVPLASELADLVEDAGALGESRGVVVEAEVSQPLTVSADRGLLRLALGNLLDNAVRYAEPGGRVGVSVRREGAQAVMRFWNTGPGIVPADQGRVFERFFRGQAPADGGRVDGSGLGLSLVREILQAHGGTADLEESRPGRTVFRAALPVGG